MNGLSNDQVTALRTRGSIATTILGAIHSDEITTAMLVGNAETLPSPHLPTEPVDLQRCVEALASYVKAMNFGEAEKLAGYVVYACETWTTPPDHGGGVPESYELWVRQGGARDAVSDLVRKQAQDAEASAKANAAPEPTRDFDTLPPGQQDALTRNHAPGAVVHVGSRDYVQVPELGDGIEALLGDGIEGGNTELGTIEGLGR